MGVSTYWCGHLTAKRQKKQNQEEKEQQQEKMGVIQVLAIGDAAEQLQSPNDVSFSIEAS